ncbi:MAG: 50S ribosomal protein L29 [Christensenellales bacterium]|jgi:large subunit ribosomal protein L29
MKIKEIRSLTTKELQVKLNDLTTELFNLRFSHATGNLPNNMALHTLKKDIARVKTIIRERQLEEGVK